MGIVEEVEDEERRRAEVKKCDRGGARGKGR